MFLQIPPLHFLFWRIHTAFPFWLPAFASNCLPFLLIQPAIPLNLSWFVLRHFNLYQSHFPFSVRPGPKQTPSRPQSPPSRSPNPPRHPAPAMSVALPFPPRTAAQNGMASYRSGSRLLPFLTHHLAGPCHGKKEDRPTGGISSMMVGSQAFAQIPLPSCP